MRMIFKFRSEDPFFCPDKIIEVFGQTEMDCWDKALNLANNLALWGDKKFEFSLSLVET